VLAIPLGLAAGRWFAELIVSTVDRELFYFEAIIAPATQAFAVLVVLCAAAASALLVRRGLDHLDLLSVLKARD
jgi:putative ABC transport system permease protein